MFTAEREYNVMIRTNLMNKIKLYEVHKESVNMVHITGRGLPVGIMWR